MYRCVAAKPGIAVFLIAALAAAGGCANLSYYLQSVSGHLDLLGRRQSIDSLLDEPDTPQALKTKLSAVLRMRDFASRELALPENSSYRQYADLQRPFVVWNVFAAAEFSTRLKEWCFPVAGCVVYRGYFSQPEAEAYAVQLKAEGLDVFVNGAPAYSTLGWFDDPVLNTFVNYPETELARIIFFPSWPTRWCTSRTTPRSTVLRHAVRRKARAAGSRLTVCPRIGLRRGPGSQAPIPEPDTEIPGAAQ